EWTKRKLKSKFDWSSRKAEDITKRDIVLLLESIMERGAPIMSNLTFAVIRKMFNFAVERDILPHSPANGIKMLAPKVARERVLTEQEIKTLWRTLDAAAMTDEIKRVLKLILVTAQRPGEVVGIHTSEIDGRWWTIPSNRSKNKTTHRVYLTDTALELIGSLKKIEKDTSKEIDKGFIFPTPLTKRDQSIDEKALSRAIRNNLAVPLLDKKGKPLFMADGKRATENRLEVEHFTPHDLRRTTATFMAQQGEMNEVIDAIQNHAKQGIIKVYNQYRYEREKQMALESWERKLLHITTGIECKIIPLNRKIS
ncbi:tyrosine-type recombinase/integrase, partial [Candidatus Nomurabacteria bacterium]|nr:tyrosine-type recombinase/integrase [Candidatus Nomurabacteria bacterium]